MDKYLVHEKRTSGRSMHALVIGVGAYTHLLDGGGRLTDSHDGMGQLTSPPKSARAMADWLIHEFNHPEYPGRTVSLLLSEKRKRPYRNPVTGKSHSVARATFNNIRKAVTRWKDRGDHDIDDALIFYFCGHGISEGDSMVLLPSDFGRNRDNAYQHSIDFLRLYDAMGQYAARIQSYFVDSCRASSDTLNGNNGNSILQVRPRVADGVRVAPVYYATLKGEDAYGMADQCSVFTDALLNCLSDYAASDDEGDDDWRVSNFRLAEALDRMMRIEKDSGRDGVQVPEGTEVRQNFYLHHLTSTPKAILAVDSDPPEKLKQAKLRCFTGNTVHAKRGAEDSLVWHTSVPTGEVEIEATLPGESQPHDVKRTHVRPIMKRVELKLR